MDTNSLMQKAISAKQRYKNAISAMQAMAPLIAANEVRANAGDDALNRSFAAKASALAAISDVREWEVNMVTSPGEMVYDPDKKHVYIYTGTTPMTHSNPTFYPGSAGVYYWMIIPELLDGVKVYPDISGIIVSVKHGEQWWNTTKTAVYTWNGVDNNACVWPPMDGNEWTEVFQTETADNLDT